MYNICFIPQGVKFFDRVQIQLESGCTLLFVKLHLTKQQSVQLNSSHSLHMRFLCFKI